MLLLLFHLNNWLNMFNKTEKKTIVDAITEAELNTSGEIRIHIDKKCKNNPIDKAVKIFEKLGEFPSFLKVDIETSEYRILDEIIKLQNKLSGLAIEFHDVDLHMDKIESFIKSLDMTLVHIHPMNQALVVNNVPIQLELSFSKNPIKVNENFKIPHHLDMPGNPSFEEINIKFQK